MNKWKKINKKHFFQPWEENAARKSNVNGHPFILSYNTAILLVGKEYEIHDSGVDGVILVCADGAIIDQL